MQDLYVTTIAVPELINLIADEIEARIKRTAISEPLSDRIDIKQAVNLIGLKQSAIYKMTMSGTIPHDKYGKRLVFSRRELEAWMEERTVRKQSPNEIASIQLAKAARKGMIK